MPKLGIQIDNNINKTTSDWKQLNKQVDITERGIDKVESNSAKLGKTMATSFKIFLLGGAVQKGFSKLLSDIDESGRKAKDLANSLRTLRFLGSAEDVAEAKRLRAPLARKGIKPGEIGPTLANIKSIAGDLPLSSRSQIAEEAAAAQGGGVGDFDPFAEAITLTAIQRPEFQTPEGITSVSNILTQGQVEARLLKKDSGKQSLALVAGLAAGLTAPETLSAFAILTKITGSPDSAIEKLKILLKLWIKTGAKSSGASFISYMMATAKKTDAELNPEELTESVTIRPFALAETRIDKATGLPQQTFTKQRERLLAAQQDPSSRAEAAFQKQLKDPRTAAAIFEAQRIAGQEDPGGRDIDVIKSDRGAAQTRVIGKAIWASILDAMIGGQGSSDTELGPLGEVIRGQFLSTISSAEKDADQRRNLDGTLQSIKADGQVNRQIQGGQ